MQKYNVGELKPIKVRLVLDWLNSRGIVGHSVTETQIDYLHSSGIALRGIPNMQNAKSLRIQVFVERKPMCFVEQSIEEVELIK